MSLSTAAIVVSHKQPQLLAETLSALSAQTHKPDQVVVVETSNDVESAQLALSFGASLVQAEGSRLGASIEAGRLAMAEQPGWLWVLHEDSIPESWALERLIKTAEISPSVAIVGGKLLDAARPGVIQQIGLSVTALGSPFLLVQDEFDQGQHDSVTDSLAVSTAGMLIRNSAWQSLGGLRDDVPLFAADVDLGARARVAGHRVIVEPAARISHHGLAMAGKRSRGWVGSSRWFALRQAQLHLAFTLPRLPFALMLFLLALPIAVLRALGQLLAKRPQRFIGELLAPLWFLFGLPRHLAARRRLSALGDRGALRGLVASPRQLRARRQAKLRHLPAAVPGTAVRGLFATGSWWLALIPMTANLQLFPRDEALLSAPLAPLGPNLAAVFSAAGADSVAALGGAGLPSDPFNWALSAIALLNPTSPSLALAAFVFAAGAPAFWGSWQLLALATERIWLRNLFALSYALSPMLLGSASALAIVDLVAIVVLPWFAFLALKTARAETSARAWRWLGAAGIAFALLAVSSSAAAVLAALFGLVLAVVHWRRALILIWMPVGGALLLAPNLLFALGSNPLLALRVSHLPEANLPTPSWHWLLLLPIAALAATGLVSARWRILLPTWLLALGALALAWWLPVGSSTPMLALAWLLVIAAAVISVSSFAAHRWLALAAISALVPGVVLSLDMRVEYEWGEARVAPALVEASNQAGENLRTLVLTRELGSIEGELQYAGAGYLEQRSLLLTALRPEDERAAAVAELSARVLAGNPSGLNQLMRETGVGFVLLNFTDREAEMNLASLPQLSAAGETRWGKLYRVDGARGVDPTVKPGQLRWLQLGALAAYLLLAIPTPAAIRGSYRRSRA